MWFVLIPRCLCGWQITGVNQPDYISTTDRLPAAARWRTAEVHERTTKSWEKVNACNEKLKWIHTEIPIGRHICAWRLTEAEILLYMYIQTTVLPCHVEVCVAYWPACTETGLSSRKTVCFQCVFVTWGPVENITWSSSKRKEGEKRAKISQSSAVNSLKRAL